MKFDSDPDHIPRGMTLASRLIEAIERRPQTAFAAFLILHGLVWTVLPAILYATCRAT
jgi:hypothetical protein